MRTIEIPGTSGVRVFDDALEGDHFERLIGRRDFRVRVSKRVDRSPYVFSANYGLESDDPVLARLREIVATIFPDARYSHGNLAMTTFGEILPVHVDSLRGEEFVPARATALYYANPAWDPEWHGETLFYQDGEPVAAVLPRPGRVVAFDARVRHCGTAPTRLCYAPRVVVAAVFG